MLMFQGIDNFIDTFITNLGVFGPFIGCLGILVESMVPILPLFVFITLNFLAFGNIWGFLISWIFTCLGCLLSFILFRKKVQTWVYKRIHERGLISKETIDILASLKFEQLVTIIAMPFTPAFLVNIVAGISNMSYKKFICSLLIGKIFLVYFWGFVGVSLVDSIKNPIYLVRVLILLLIAYGFSKIINKKLKIS